MLLGAAHCKLRALARGVAGAAGSAATSLHRAPSQLARARSLLASERAAFDVELASARSLLASERAAFNAELARAHSLLASERAAFDAELASAHSLLASERAAFDAELARAHSLLASERAELEHARLWLTTERELRRIDAEILTNVRDGHKYERETLLLRLDDAERRAATSWHHEVPALMAAIARVDPRAP